MVSHLSLAHRGLADSPGLNTVMTGDGLRAPRGTNKGREFMRFITRDGAQ